ncbi:hypothetical protein GXW82_37485 [Streptacidiphilus sp. 4-A2]|nr:hypothetical protein [Streptacidiphilus sp. 4-A2]
MVGGTVVLGAASYIQIAAAGHMLPSGTLSAISVLWSLTMSLSLGLFFPIEQELTRAVAARVVRGEGAAPVLRRAAVLTVGLLALITLALGLSAPQLARLFFADQQSLVWAFAGALAGMGLVFLTRGILAGLGLFRSYGISLALDGGLRIVLALGLALAGVHSALAYALVLTVAPLAAMLLTLPTTLRASLSGAPMPWSELSQNMGTLMCSSLLAQAVVNAAVLSVKLLSPAETALVTALLNAGVLARVPLFVFGSLQPTLMTGLSTAATSGDRAGFRRMLRQTCAVVGGLGLLGGVPSVLLGPWLIRVLFDAPASLGRLAFLWLAVGTVFYMLALVLGQAVVALGRHRLQLLSWAVGTAALAGVTLMPGDLAQRVLIAYAVGSMVVAAGALVSLLAGMPRQPLGTVGAGQPAPGVDAAASRS